MVRGLLLLLLLAGTLGGFYWLRSGPGPEDRIPPTAGSARDHGPDARGGAEGEVRPALLEATRLDPPDAAGDPEGARWVERNNRATGLLEEGELAEAVELLEGCHEARPEDPVFRRNLAEALVRLAVGEREGEGELGDAVDHLTRAIELGHDRPDVENLRAALERWRRELDLAEDQWTDRSLYFELSYDAERRDLVARALELLRRLEDDYADLRDWFGADPVMDGGRPIRVVLHGDEEFSQLTGLGDWAGGSFDGVIRVPTTALERDEARVLGTLRHELVHAFVHELGGRRVPGWLNEGLAQWLEGASRPATREEQVRIAHRTLEGTELFPLEELAGNLASWSDADAIRRAYAESLLFVRLIALDPGYGEEALRRMVHACGAGEEPAAAFEAYTQVPLAFAFERLAREG